MSQVQDMFNPEIFVGAFREPGGHWETCKYSDMLHKGPSDAAETKVTRGTFAVAALPYFLVATPRRECAIGNPASRMAADEPLKRCWRADVGAPPLLVCSGPCRIRVVQGRSDPSKIKQSSAGCPRG